MTRFTLARTRVAAAVFTLGILGTVCEVDGQDMEIGIIDFYGLRHVSVSQVRDALTFKEGDRFSTATDERPSFLQTTEDRLATVPGIARARTNMVCCDQGRAIVYVGIEERGGAMMQFRAAPQGTARLVPDIVQADEEFMKAFRLAILRGDSAEDYSQGHALSNDPATRAIQERFVVYAEARSAAELRLVLRTPSDAAQRALSALVLAYAPDKQAVVDDLVQAMSDPSDEVRNNAMRALFVFVQAVPSVTGPLPQVPVEPFIGFLNSPVWSDLNKASVALMALSASRDPGLLARLRNEALTPLVEMARWKAGHGFAAFIILGRIAGYSDEAARDLFDRGDREIVIEAAIKGQRPAV